jgi:hypothetical protein
MRRCLLAAVLALSITGSVQALSQVRPERDTPSITEIVARIANDPDPESRYQAIKRLTFVLHRDSSRAVESDVMALAGLLRDSDDLVRHWAALAIGQIGPRAASAVPALQLALSQVQCIRADKNSQSGITFALRRIGVSPVLAECVATENYGLEVRRDPARR